MWIGFLALYKDKVLCKGFWHLRCSDSSYNLVYRRSLTLDVQPESYTIFNYKNKDSCNRSVVADVTQLESQKLNTFRNCLEELLLFNNWQIKALSFTCI